MSTAAVAEPQPHALEYAKPKIANVPGRLGPAGLNRINGMVGVPWKRRLCQAALVLPKIRYYETKYMQLSEEDIRRECVCAFETFTTNGSNQKALWCHIRARKRCRSEDEKKDTANRLVMNWALHSMFDDNLTNDGATPTLSVYCNPKSTIFNTT